MKLVGGLTLRKLASFPQSAFLKPHLEELEKSFRQSNNLQKEDSLQFGDCQTVDKALLLQGFAIVGTAFLI